MTRALALLPSFLAAVAFWGGLAALIWSAT